MSPHGGGNARTKLEVTGSLTLESLALEQLGDSSASTPSQRTIIQVDLSTGEDHTITLDFSQSPPVRSVSPLAKRVWQSRAALAQWFTQVGQPLHVRVAGQTWLSIEIEPSRLGRLLQMPGLTFRLAGGTILLQRLRQSFNR